MKPAMVTGEAFTPLEEVAVPYQHTTFVTQRKYWKFFLFCFFITRWVFLAEAVVSQAPFL